MTAYRMRLPPVLLAIAVAYCTASAVLADASNGIRMVGITLWPPSPWAAGWRKTAAIVGEMEFVAELQVTEDIFPPQQPNGSISLNHWHLVQRVFHHQLQCRREVGVQGDRLEGHGGHDAAHCCGGPQLLR